jgi:predicted nucleic acid-binding protein
MLLDTSGLLCCFDVTDVRHVRAVDAYSSASVRLTHNYVLAEFVALAHARSMPRAASLVFAADVLSDSEIEVVWVDPPLHDEAMRLLQSQHDKSYSLCDAVSFALMHQRNLIEALTTDGHFDQAGFQRLLPQ